MGFGKSSGSSAPVVTQEQKDLLKAQTGFLTETAFPSYVNTISAAKDALYGSAANALPAMQSALNYTERGAQVAQQVGEQGLYSGVTGLQSLFSPEYKQQQIEAALQPAREDIREQVGAQNAMFGGAGGAGSSRAALARENLRQLGEQRMATAAAQASAGVEANRAAAASKLADIGTTSIPMASQLQTGRIAISQTPQDLLNKYASVIYGTPQQSTTPNFAGTQGQNTSSKGFGASMKW